VTNEEEETRDANHERGETKFTALISVATPPTEFKEPKGA
jgi:hypothetical protein